MDGCPPLKYKFLKIDRAIQIPEKSALKLTSKTVVKLDADLLLQRLANLPDSGPNNQKANAFKYELATFPAALFKEEGSMRPANTKSKLANYMLDKFRESITCTDSGTVLVLDGGMLLHSLSHT